MHKQFVKDLAHHLYDLHIKPDNPAYLMQPPYPEMLFDHFARAYIATLTSNVPFKNKFTCIPFMEEFVKNPLSDEKHELCCKLAWQVQEMCKRWEQSLNQIPPDKLLAHPITSVPFDVVYTKKLAYVKFQARH